MPKDTERLKAFLRVTELGYGDRLTHSHDVCTRSQLAAYRGVGHSHLPRRLPGRLREAGLGEEEIRRQLAGNAMRFLGPDRPFAAPDATRAGLPT